MTASGGKAPVLEMHGIEKRFGPVAALSGVSFTVCPGSVHALVGENGAGKSTLMKILAGVYRPDAGTIRLDGRPRRFTRPADALAAGISMIYQELDLVPDLSVAENVFLGCEPPGAVPFTLDFKRMCSESRQLFDLFDCRLDPATKVRDVSAADAQMVEIVKALNRRASILVMDEPTSSLSAADAERLLATVRTLREQGLSVVYISHRLEEVFQVADDLTILRDGRAVHSGPAGRLAAAEIVRHMVGRDLTEFYPPRRVTLGPVRLRVQNLATHGVEDVSFEIRAGQIVGMAGLVGAGRTQIARGLFGVAPLTAGTIELDGEPVRIDSPGTAVDKGIAFLTEDRKRTGLCLNLPAAWNITLPSLSRLFGRLIRPARENTLAAAMAERISIKWSGPGQVADTLSGGNQQKLLVARWLLARSRILIFDEPTRGIDVGAKREVYELMNQLAAEGRAILMISSELEELFGMTDQILVLRRGRLAGTLTTPSATPEAVMRLAALEETISR